MRCSWLLTGPIWLAGDRAEAVVGALLAPLGDPLAWQASMGYREALGLLAGLLCVLVMARAMPPPVGPIPFSGGPTSVTALAPRKNSQPTILENTR
jgi:hypothetical protein